MTHDQNILFLYNKNKKIAFLTPIHLSLYKREGVAEVGKSECRGYLFGRPRKSRKDRISLPVPSEPCRWKNESLVLEAAWAPLGPPGQCGGALFVPKATRRLAGLALLVTGTGITLSADCNAVLDKAPRLNLMTY
jgi:hypothetical protein